MYQDKKIVQIASFEDLWVSEKMLYYCKFLLSDDWWITKEQFATTDYRSWQTEVEFLVVCADVNVDWIIDVLVVRLK